MTRQHEVDAINFQQPLITDLIVLASTNSDWLLLERLSRLEATLVDRKTALLLGRYSA